MILFDNWGNLAAIKKFKSSWIRIYDGQITLSTLLIKRNIRFHFPPSKPHSFLKTNPLRVKEVSIALLSNEDNAVSKGWWVCDSSEFPTQERESDFGSNISRN